MFLNLKIMSYLKRKNGTAAVEFALIVPMLFFVLSGIFNFGLILIKKEKLNSVINAGMLYAIQSNSSLPNIQTQMTSATNINPLTISTNQFCACSDGSTVVCTAKCTGNVTPGTYINMTASSKVSLVAPDFIISNPYSISATATIRIN
jgi:Flp pilus assembly protein TadG